LESEEGDTIYTTLTIKIVVHDGGRQAGSKCNKQQRTQLFLLSYTRSTNLAALTVSAKMTTPTPASVALRIWELPPRRRHIVDANQSVKWSDPKLWLEKYALMDFLLPHNCANFITSTEGSQKAAATAATTATATTAQNFYTTFLFFQFFIFAVEHN